MTENTLQLYITTQMVEPGQDKGDDAKVSGPLVSTIEMSSRFCL